MLRGSNRPLLPDDLATGEERLLNAWCEHVADAYPNPERKGCPQTSVLELLVTDVETFSCREDADDILLHLGSCAPCGSDLRELRRRTLRTPAVPSSKILLWAAGVLALLTIGGIVVRKLLSQ